MELSKKPRPGPNPRRQAGRTESGLLAPQGQLRGEDTSALSAQTPSACTSRPLSSTRAPRARRPRREALAVSPGAPAALGEGGLLILEDGLEAGWGLKL